MWIRTEKSVFPSNKPSTGRKVTYRRSGNVLQAEAVESGSHDKAEEAEARSRAKAAEEATGSREGEADAAGLKRIRASHLLRIKCPVS